MRRTGRSLLLVVVCLAMLSLTGSMALGQGVQTGTLTGTVKLPDGSGLPGVTVTISSPAMQGTRTQVTGSAGDYVFKFLPPGDYKVDFEISGMKTVTRYASLAVGGSAVADATMAPSTTAEVTVLGAAEEVDKTTVHSSTYEQTEINQLPIGRRIDQVVTLAPNVSDQTPNGGVQVSGALSYDNVWLVDGVDINDNLFGTSTNALVIEEAVQETKILTSSVSAEYGRFSGGVINAVTKTGGNEFHGSARIDLTNNDWQATTPYEQENGITHPNKTNEVYSGTLGGKFITDTLWFFGAGRYFKTSNQDTFDITNETFDATDEEPRYEAKLTANLFQSHTLQGTYTHSKETLVQKPLGFSIEASTLVEPTYPSDLIVGTYNGVITPNLFASLQYSRKKFQFAGYGGTGKDVQLDSPRVCFFLPLCQFGQPYFDATDPEDRDNNQWAGSLNYFLGTKSFGSHDIKAGFEIFKSISRGGNSQSSTDFTFYNDYKTDDNGDPIFDANHQLIPIWQTGGDLNIHWFPTRGAEADIRTDSFYINDIWRFGQFTANLGLRYEKVKGHGPEGTVTADSDSIVPRISVAYDVLNDGRYTVTGSYAEYSGGYNPIAFNQITNVGNPSYVYYFYLGPPGEGYDFAPGYDLSNYVLAGGAFPTRNVALQDGLHSPRTREWSGSIGGQILQNTYAAITYLHRDYKDFIIPLITIETGSTSIPELDGAVLDNKVYSNTELIKRTYQSISMQSRTNFWRNFWLQIAYTYTIKNEGNSEEEAVNQPFSPANIGSFPELQAPDRNFPLGRLSTYQKHKLRVFPNYTFCSGFGNFNFGMIYNYDSGLPYSLVAFNQPFSDIQLARDPGYAVLPTTQDIYFGRRGTGTFPGQSRFDLAFTYDINVWRTIAPWIQLRVINLFNTAFRTGFNTTITPCTDPTQAGCNGAAPLDANGLPTTFTTVGTPFGTATSNTQFQQSRTFSINAGIRF
ncbi:MAG TPA: TonB-dependent receptor [Thermoanaerobaculia bacterium]|jgi:hypothetical protein